jgi:hypothetical protein
MLVSKKDIFLMGNYISVFSIRHRPAGYGAQPIYKWTAKLAVNGKPADESSRETGLRSIVLRRNVLARSVYLSYRDGDAEP